MNASRAWLVLALLVVASCGGGAVGTGTSVDVGGTWTAVDVAGHIPDRLDAPRIQFTEGGRIQGSTGCNDFSAEVQINGDRIAIGPIENTDVGCGGKLGEIEAAFISALRVAHGIAGGSGTGRLVLTGPGGELVLAQPAP